MGFQKNYLNNLVCACAPDNAFAQEAIEFALVSDWVALSGTFNLETDQRIVMAQYDAIIAGYHTVIRNREELAA